MVHFALENYLVHNELNTLTSSKRKLISFLPKFASTSSKDNETLLPINTTFAVAPPIEKEQEERARWGSTPDSKNTQMPCSCKIHNPQIQLNIQRRPVTSS